MKRATRKSTARAQEEEELLLPTQAIINKNVQADTFFRVRGKKSAKNQLSLGGAKNMWANKPNFVYLPEGYNLAGDYEDVATVLNELVDNPEEVRDLMSRAITSQNYDVPQAEGGEKEVYDKILSNYEARTKGAEARKKQGYTTTGKPVVTLAMAKYIEEQIKNGEAEIVTSATTTKTKARAAPVGKGQTAPTRKRVTRVSSGRNKTITSKLNALQEGKVLNVSKMDENGIGARVINAPGPSSIFVGVDLNKLPIVSSTEEGFANAMNLLSQETGIDYNVLVQEWIAAKENVPVRSNRPVAVSKVASRRERIVPVSSAKGKEKVTSPLPLERQAKEIASGEVPAPEKVVTPPRSPIRRGTTPPPPRSPRRSPVPVRSRTPPSSPREEIISRLSPKAKEIADLPSQPAEQTATTSPTLARRRLGGLAGRKLGGLKLPGLGARGIPSGGQAQEY